MRLGSPIGEPVAFPGRRCQAFFHGTHGTFAAGSRNTGVSRQRVENIRMSRSPEPTDADLLARSLAGDEAAFLHLYRRTQGPVFRFAMQMSGSRSIAEDVTQEVFLALARDGSRFDSTKGTLQSYLFGMTRNLVLRRFDKRATLVSIDVLIDAAKMVKSVTTHMFTSNAADVLAVRFGFRTALRDAIRPDTPRNQPIGAPSSRPAGRAAIGAKMR